MIVLVGFMGAGKTTVGRALAAQLGLPFIDSDQVIERSLDLSIADIFEGYGEAGFRDIEAGTIAGLLAGPPAVLALGGGAVGRSETRQALRGHVVVFLSIPYAAALARVGGDAARPVLRNPDLPALFAERAAAYADVATLTVDTGDRSPRELAEEIAARLTDSRMPAVDQPTLKAGE